MEYLDFLDELPPDSTYWQPIFDFGQETFAEAPYNNLESLTAQIKQGFLDYCKQGIMLQVVRRYRLYKAKYKDFTEYCERELGRSAAYCRKIIDAAEVALALIRDGFEILPKCVAQALPLKKFLKKSELSIDTEELCSNWKAIVDSLPENQITASKIADALDENPDGKTQKVSINGKIHKVLQKKALAAGMSASKYLEKLIADAEDTELEEDFIEEEEKQPTEIPDREAILEATEAYIVSKSQPIADATAERIPTGDRSNRSDAMSDSS
jgi:hypothetical protein